MTGVWRGAKVAIVVAVLAICGPAVAASIFDGVWNMTVFEDWPDRIPGPELGDYAGLPLNAADRLRATTWDASILSLPDYQCRVHPSDYANSFADIRMWSDIDTTTQQLIAIHIQHFAWNTVRSIWMDGRPHPPDYAEHTSMGFSTGEFVGDALRVTTTHLKEGWLRRNGVARSDSATVTEYFIRHGSHLNWSVFVQDPKYLEEPFFRNRDYTLGETGAIAPYPCESVVEVLMPPDYFPHHLPGKNPFLIEYAKNHHIPEEAAMGGAATMYPEYRKKLAQLPQP